MSIFLTGYFNSRIGKENDYIEYDSLLDLCGDGYISDTFYKNRTSRDTVVNNFGLSLLSLCRTFDIHILNGRNDKDQYGEFTCETVRGRSVADYIIVSTTLFDSVIEYNVGSYDKSDHFPLYCLIEGNSCFTQSEHVNISKYYRVKWDNDKKTN